MKDELIQQLRLLGMGRVSAAQAIADILMPDQPNVAEVTESTAQELIERFDGPATVDIEIEPEALPDPGKPKRKKGLMR